MMNDDSYKGDAVHRAGRWLVCFGGYAIESVTTNCCECFYLILQVKFICVINRKIVVEGHSNSLSFCIENFLYTCFDLTFIRESDALSKAVVTHFINQANVSTSRQ